MAVTHCCWLSGAEDKEAREGNPMGELMTCHQ